MLRKLIIHLTEERLVGYTIPEERTIKNIIEVTDRKKIIKKLVRVFRSNYELDFDGWNGHKTYIGETNLPGLWEEVEMIYDEDLGA